MQIIKEYPPNYEQIKLAVNPPKEAFFPWGEKLYNPSGVEIPEDIIYHEQVHWRQQREFPSPAMWWQKWCLDKEFRKQQETEAFAHQWHFVKRFYPTKASDQALEEFSEQLADHYKLGINKYEAKTLIRKYAI